MDGNLALTLTEIDFPLKAASNIDGGVLSRTTGLRTVLSKENSELWRNSWYRDVCKNVFFTQIMSFESEENYPKQHARKGYIIQITFSLVHSRFLSSSYEMRTNLPFVYAFSTFYLAFGLSRTLSSSLSCV